MSVMMSVEYSKFVLYTVQTVLRRLREYVNKSFILYVNIIAWLLLFCAKCALRAGCKDVCTAYVDTCVATMCVQKCFAVGQ
jgi:hypothetical protein